MPRPSARRPLAHETKRPCVRPTSLLGLDLTRATKAEEPTWPIPRTYPNARPRAGQPDPPGRHGRRPMNFTTATSISSRSASSDTFGLLGPFVTLGRLTPEAAPPPYRLRA